MQPVYAGCRLNFSLWQKVREKMGTKCWFFKDFLESCRTPRGVRGLKFLNSAVELRKICRTPRGVRGLKYPVDYTVEWKNGCDIALHELYDDSISL